MAAIDRNGSLYHVKDTYRASLPRSICSRFYTSSFRVAIIRVAESVSVRFRGNGEDTFGELRATIRNVGMGSFPPRRTWISECPGGNSMRAWARGNRQAKA